MPLMCWDKSDCRKHINSARHKEKKSGEQPLLFWLTTLTLCLASVAFGAYACILLACTLYDVMIYQHLDEQQKFYNRQWITFSLYTNAKKLFSYTPSIIADDYLECINGIKVISMLWVVFGHRILLNVFSGNINGIYILEWKGHLENTFIFGATFAVDTFLLLSGLLLAYGYLKYKSIWENGEAIPLTAFYGMRVLRLSPALLAAVLFYISIFKNLSDGPIWSIVSKKFAGSCLSTWWGTMFFINNYISMDHQCVEHSWYLSVDTQLYIISPIILINLQRSPWKTILACLATCVASALYSFVITISNNYGVIHLTDGRYLDNIYLPTFVRMPPWLIGIMFGYVIFKYRHVRIPERTNLFMWCCSFSLMLYLILVHIVFTRNDYNPLSSALFNSCARPAWAVALGCIIFCCVSGHGGTVNQFLSLPIFQVLVKLTYSVYIVHLAVLVYFVAGKRNPDYFSNINNVRDFMGDLLFVFITATIWCLSFESPFIAISKIIVNKAKGTVLVRSDAIIKDKNERNYLPDICLEKSKQLTCKKAM